MADPVGAILGRPFAEQLAAFRLRMQDLHPSWAWDDLAGPQHDRKFTVAGSAAAGAAKADLLADIARSMEKAIEGKSTLDGFRKDFRAIVEKHGWHGWTGEGTARGEAWRTRVIYRTNMATSYAAGRHAQLTRGNYRFWVYHHGGSEHPRLHHLSWDGVALPPDHPFWASHYPPNGWGCSCYASGTNSRAGIRRLGGDPDKQLPTGWDAISPKTGAPTGIDRGWGHAPGRTAAAEINAAVGKQVLSADPSINMVNGKLPKLPAAIGSAMFHAAASPRRVDQLVQEFGAFVDQALTSHVQQRHMIIGALQPGWVLSARQQGVRIESGEIAITDKNILHTFRGTPHVAVPGTRTVQRDAKVQPLDLAWFKALPRHLLMPRLVLLDTLQKEPAFVLVYDVPSSAAKLIVEINTPIRKAGTILNSVVSGRHITIDHIRSDLARGLLKIDGNL